VRRLPGSHASRPCAGERFSPSMIQAYQGQYHSVWVPCTRPHKEWTVDGLPPQVALVGFQGLILTWASETRNDL